MEEEGEEKTKLAAELKSMQELVPDILLKVDDALGSFKSANEMKEDKENDAAATTDDSSSARLAGGDYNAKPATEISSDLIRKPIKVGGVSSCCSHQRFHPINCSLARRGNDRRR